MRFRAHIALRRELPGPALCGKPVKREARRALFVCTRCVSVLLREYLQKRRFVVTWNYTADKEVQP